MDDAYLRHRGATTLPQATCWVCGAEAGPDASYSGLELYRCPQCGFLFAPRRAAESLQALYGAQYFDEYPGGESYEEDEEQRRYEARIRVALVQRFLDTGRLYEVGAAAGHFLDEARKAGFEVSGIEPARPVAERARERLGVDAQTGFLEQAVLTPSTFDVVCAWHVLEHLAEPHTALQKLRTALRPGGHLLVEVPNIDSVYARRRGKSWFHLDPDHHVGHYARRSLGMALERAGFEVLEMETFPALGYVRPGRALRPASIAVQLKELADVRTAPRRPHPSKHELLRAFATPAPDPGSGR